MRNLTALTIFFLLSAKVQGQKEDLNYNKVVQRFESIYNEGKYDRLFYLFSPEMQKELPLGKTTSFLSATKSVAGKMLMVKF